LTVLNRIVLSRDEAAYGPLASHRSFSETLAAAPDTRQPMCATISADRLRSFVNGWEGSVMGLRKSAEAIPAWVKSPRPDERKSHQRFLKSSLRLLRACLPGDRLKTMVYLGVIAAPRKLLRRGIGAFYRFDHVYDVLREFTGAFQPPFSVLEFGTARGYSFAKLLYATRYLGIEDKVTVHSFDTFQGLPEVTNAEDADFMGGKWMKGAYRGSFEALQAYCEARAYRNFRIHRGLFEDTLTDAALAELHRQPPILIWVDCDLYTSSVTVFEKILPVLRNGCVLYFDDLEFNFASRFTGQARLIHEINHGKYGDVELILDTDLSWDSRRVYRFMRYGENVLTYEPRFRRETPPIARPIRDGSPFL
jgi:hypothetical protein